MSMIKKSIKLAIAVSFTASALTTSVLSVAAQEEGGTDETELIETGETSEESTETSPESSETAGSEESEETPEAEEGETSPEEGEEASEEASPTYGGLPVRKVLEFLNWVINDPNTAPVDGGDGELEAKRAEIKNLLENGTDEDIKNWIDASMEEENEEEPQELTEEQKDASEFYSIYLMALGTKYIPNVMSEEEFLGEDGMKLLEEYNSKMAPEEKEQLDALIELLKNGGMVDPDPTKGEEPGEEPKEDGSEEVKEENKEENPNEKKEETKEEDKEKTEEKKDETAKTEEKKDDKKDSSKTASSGTKTSVKVATAAGFDMLQLVNAVGIMAGAVYVMRKKEEE